MANIMIKRGSEDNIITYVHICDEESDKANIDPREITLGTVCIVLETTGMKVYMARSDKQWVNLSNSASDEESSDNSESNDESNP